jgi:fermentation-respiration switch protein FrsA (DUF1100 family)
MLRLQWRSIEHIAHVTVPLLFIAGMKDEIVPPAQMRLLELAAVASPAVEMHKVTEGTHNDTWMKAGPQLVHWLDEFIRKAGRGPPPVPRCSEKRRRYNPALSVVGALDFLPARPAHTALDAGTISW